MNDRFRKAWDPIRADESLKSRTKSYVLEAMRGKPRSKPVLARRLIPAVACALLLLIGSYWLYFTPTVQLSIDINPSVELGVNRFNTVVSVHGYNDDGVELADSLDLKYLSYTEAVDEILGSETVQNLLLGDAVLSIGVIGSENAQSAEMLSTLESCTANNGNTYCYIAGTEELHEAHGLGLSCGKYRMYLEIQALDPTITPEDVQDMTMRELWDLLDSLTGSAAGGGQAGSVPQTDCENGSEADCDNGSESGNGYGNGYGYGGKHGGERGHGQWDD